MTRVNSLYWIIPPLHKYDTQKTESIFIYVQGALEPYIRYFTFSLRNYIALFRL